MSRTIQEKQRLTNDKMNSAKLTDRLVADELLKMGFSYNSIGTHYLHDSIVYSASLRLEDFNDVNEFCRKVGAVVRGKYNVGGYQYSGNITQAIERAFVVGNIEYLMETFKSSYDRDKDKVTKNAFIMTVRKKIMNDIEVQQPFDIVQLRTLIKDTAEKITDSALLKSICDIMLSLNGKTIIT